MKQFGINLLLLAFVSVVSEEPALAGDGESLPGRVFSLSLGINGNTSFGDEPARLPGILQFGPEVQLGFGIQLSDRFLVLTRFDVLGTMLPLGPMGLGLDLAVAWTSAGTHPETWAPMLRFTGGALWLVTGDFAYGPDYEASGIRAALEAGAARGVPLGQTFVLWSVLAGVHATRLSVVEPCDVDTGCSEALTGATLRCEVTLLF